MTAQELIAILAKLDPDTLILGVEGDNDPFLSSVFVEHPDPATTADGRHFVVIATNGDEVETSEDE